MLRQVVKFFRRHNVTPETVEACSTGDFRRVKNHIGRAADRHRDDHGVPNRVSTNNVARRHAFLNHAVEIGNEFVRKLIHPSRVVGWRRHHMQRLETNHTDESLHGVVGEHTATATVAGARFTGDAFFDLWVLMASGLEAAHDVQEFSCHRVFTRTNWAIGHDDRRAVMLEQCRQGSNRRFVAGYHRDGAL